MHKLIVIYAKMVKKNYDTDLIEFSSIYFSAIWLFNDKNEFWGAKPQTAMAIFTGPQNNLTNRRKNPWID